MRATSPTARVLEDRSAIVIGASSGIGRATARLLARHGATIYLAGRSAQRLEEARTEILREQGRAFTQVLDVNDHAAISALVERVVADTGRLNIMINGAGVEYIGSIAEGDPQRWRDMLETNVLALLVGAQAAIRAMRATNSEGHIVHFGSIAGRSENTGVYGATKAAVHALTTTLRAELENDPIRVVNVIPGAILTNFIRTFPEPMLNAFLEQTGSEPDFVAGKIYDDDRLADIQRRAEHIVGRADDVAQAVLYAVSQPVTVNVYEIFVRPPRNLS
jgi:NADP-dependent 3-hydroxy acid dehydrogenase YdfG